MARAIRSVLAFDLDVVMTSEREWAFYASVPGIATHQLVRRDGIDAVHVTIWEWNGRSRRRIEREFSGQVPAPAGTAAGHDDPDDSALW